jgi:hypothetical protein
LAQGADRLEPRGELVPLAELLGEPASDDERTVSLLREDLIALLGSPLLAEFSRAHVSVQRVEATAFLAKLTGAALGHAIGDALRARPEPHHAARLVAGV